jgi:hypothetical protein
MSTTGDHMPRFMLPSESGPADEAVDQESISRTPVGRIVHRIPLFVIKKKGQEQFWACSSEHGSGWCDRHPKQSFTKSELAKEIHRLIDRDWFTDIEILQLHL